MKEIKAYIRDNMVDQVVDALESLPGVPGVAVVPVGGFGRSAADGSVQRVERTKLEIDVLDDQVAAVVDCIMINARTGAGHPGDGKIYVSELADATRIHDGARGDAVLDPDG